MRGRQLVCIKVHKPKILSLYENPVGYIQGISEEIEIITPRDRTVKNRRYLKSISPNMPSIHKPRGISNSSIADSMQNHAGVHSKAYDSSFYNFSQRNKQKFFRLDPTSKFSLQFHVAEEKEMKRLNHELFPEEIIDDIEYLPDYTPSSVATHLALQKSKSRLKKFKTDYNTVGNVLKSRLEVRKIDMQKLRKSKFTTYSTGWDSFYERSPNKTPKKLSENIKNIIKNIYT